MAATVLVIVAALAFFFYPPIQNFFDSGEEDRPPIIVRNGSLIFESEKNWVPDPSNNKQFKPDHGKGASVTGYAVTLTGSSTASCTAVTLTGTEVLVDYKADSTAAVQFHLHRKIKFSSPAKWKNEPALDSPEALTNNNATGTTPAQLIYPAGAKGWISSVTVGTTPCAFTEPADDAARKAVHVDIKPTR